MKAPIKERIIVLQYKRLADEALTTLAKEVPYFADWKKASGLIDFGGDINTQLCTLVNLTKTEVAYVANTIRTLDNSRNRKSVPHPKE